MNNDLNKFRSVLKGIIGDMSRWKGNYRAQDQTVSD